MLELCMGVKETLTELRSKFWIVRGRQFVRTLLSKCKVCKRFNSRPLIGPPPPPLPDFRVQAAPPFSFIGVDHVGPLYLKNGRKVWICLFTCLSHACCPSGTGSGPNCRVIHTLFETILCQAGSSPESGFG